MTHRMPGARALEGILQQMIVAFRPATELEKFEANIHHRSFRKGGCGCLDKVAQEIHGFRHILTHMPLVEVAFWQCC